MGYNGNNRGRTHNWSGVGDKRHYNWGLNLTARAMVAPFAILSALSKIETTPSSSIVEEPVETFSHRNSVPSELIKALENKNDELHINYRKVAFIKQDIKNIKWNIFLLGLDVIHRKSNKRKKQLLKYIVERRERLISPIDLTSFNVGSSIKPDSVNGRVAIHDTPQHNNSTFSLGCLCKKSNEKKHKEINYQPTLSIGTRNWQMLVFEKAIFVENRKGFVLIPYENIKISYDSIYNSGLTRTYDYRVVQTNWYHSRLDGGPDRRFKENFQMYTIIRHQATISVDGFPKSIYLTFETPYDYNVIAKAIENQKKVKQLKSTKKQKRTSGGMVIVESLQ